MPSHPRTRTSCSCTCPTRRSCASGCCARGSSCATALPSASPTTCGSPSAPGRPTSASSPSWTFRERLLHSPASDGDPQRSEEHTSELQSRPHLVCRLLLEKKNISYYFSCYLKY